MDTIDENCSVITESIVAFRARCTEEVLLPFFTDQSLQVVMASNPPPATDGVPAPPPSPPAALAEIRLVLLGRKGAGKSAAGNTVLGGAGRFESGKPTEECVKWQAEVYGRRVTVVDTPGWEWYYPLNSTPNWVRRETLRSVSLCPPGPHAVLLVVRSCASVTDAYIREMEEHLEPLGRGAWGRAMLLFTRGDELGLTSMEQRIASSGPALRRLLRMCGDRYHVVDNLSKGDAAQVPELIRKLEQMGTGHLEMDHAVLQGLEADGKRRERERRRKQRQMEAQVQRGTIKDALTSDGPQGSELDAHRSFSKAPRRLSEVRLVLLGERETGKSAAGNAILGQSGFFRAGAVTEECVRGQAEVALRLVTVVDTPGWEAGVAGATPERVKREIVGSVALCPPGPHGLLLTLRADTLVRAAHVREHLELLGEGVWRHTMLVFTHADQLREGVDIEQHIQGGGRDLQWLMEKCGGRYQVVGGPDGSAQVTGLLEKVEKMAAMNRCEAFSGLVQEVRDLSRRRKEKFNQRLKDMGDKMLRQEVELKNMREREVKSIRWFFDRRKKVKSPGKADLQREEEEEDEEARRIGDRRNDIGDLEERMRWLTEDKEREIQDLSVEKERNRVALNQSRKERDQAVLKLEVKERELEELKERIDEQQVKLLDLERASVENDQERKQREDAMRAKKKEWMERVEKLEETVEHHEKEKAEWMEKVDSFKAEMEEAKKRWEEVLHQEKQENNREKSQLEEKVKKEMEIKVQMIRDIKLQHQEEMEKKICEMEKTMETANVRRRKEMEEKIKAVQEENERENGSLRERHTKENEERVKAKKRELEEREKKYNRQLEERIVENEKEKEVIHRNHKKDMDQKMREKQKEMDDLKVQHQGEMASKINDMKKLMEERRDKQQEEMDRKVKESQEDVEREYVEKIRDMEQERKREKVEQEEKVAQESEKQLQERERAMRDLKEKYATQIEEIMREKEKEKEIVHQNNKIVLLEKRQEGENEKERHKKETEDKQKEIEEITEQLKQLRETLRRTAEEREADGLHQKKHMRHKLEENERVIGKLKRHIEDIEEILQRSEEERDLVMLRQQKEAERRLRETEEMEGEVKDKEREIERLQAEIEELREEGEKQEGRIGELERRGRRTDGERMQTLQENQREVLQLKLTIQQTKSELKELTGKVEKETTSMIREYEKEIARRDEKVDSAAKEKNEAQKRAEELGKEMDNFKVKNGALERELEASEETFTRKESGMQSLLKERDEEVRALVLEKDQLREEVERRREGHDGVKAQMEELRQKEQEMKVRAEEVQRKEREMESLLGVLEGKQRELSSHGEDLQKKAKELRERERHLQREAQELQRRNQKVDSTAQQLDDVTLLKEELHKKESNLKISLKKLSHWERRLEEGEEGRAYENIIRHDEDNTNARQEAAVRSSEGDVHFMYQEVNERRETARSSNGHLETLTEEEEMMRGRGEETKQRRREKEQEELESITQDRTLFPQSCSEEWRVVVLGESWSPCSPPGGVTLLGGEEPTLGGATFRSWRAQAAGRRLAVVEPLGLRWSDGPEPSRKGRSLQDSVSRCRPGPHVVLVLLPAFLTCTQKHRRAVERSVASFGEGVWRRTLVLFTWGETLGVSAEQHILRNAELTGLVEKCGGRYHVLTGQKTKCVNEGLLKKMEDIVALNGGEQFE